MKQNYNVFMKKFWYRVKHTHSQREVLRKRTKHTYFGGRVSRKWNQNVVKITVYMLLSTLHFKDRQPGIRGYGPIFAKGSLKERETGKPSFSGLYSHWVSSKPLCGRKGKLPLLSEEHLPTSWPREYLLLILIKIMCSQKWNTMASQVLTMFSEIRK